MSRALVAAFVLAAALLESAPAHAVPFSAKVRDTGTTMLRTVDAEGNRSALFGPFTVASDGHVSGTIPAAIVRGVKGSADDHHRATLALETASGAPVGSVNVSAAPDGPVIKNDFVSSKGWVKPGQAYPFTLRVLNYGATPLVGARVTVAAPDGTSFAAVDWAVPTVPAKAPDGTPGVQIRVVEARADTLAQDAEIAWKNLSSTATLTYPGGQTQAVASHGPKVIPPNGGFETSRYGDRPFPVVPVDYRDRKHAAASTAGKLAGKINDPAIAGSTFNLFQEVSYGQLFPHGTVPSEATATAVWGATSFRFSQAAPQCTGNTNASLPADGYKTGSRIQDGWYQLPGDTQYYGLDGKGSALIGALGGVGALQDIDSGCGPTGKAVYDAAAIADPEINYDDYDTDKDGVVDFFMMVFPGLGGNGDSQVNGFPPYDNIWPHSSDLQNGYSDANGEKGFVTSDQSHDLEGRPLFWTDASRSAKTTSNTGIPVYTRVGPYNVNPESAIENASVISHEYGHSLGLPDYYSTGSRETYGQWTLMATDYSQNIDVIGKKELGWLVPRVLEPGQRVASNWADTKKDTGRIDWKRADGTPYTLTGPGVHNGEAYAATLPGRQIMDPKIVPSGTHVYWSGSGNDFGCAPDAGHNLDLALPALPAGAQKLTLTFKSRWDIEWDYDYGFVLSSTDNGKSYKSYASAKGYTTPATQNPNANGCLSKYGHGITGASGSYEGGSQAVDRLAGMYPSTPFLGDEYDISDLVGKAGAVLRFSYFTDPGLARPGWFIDDVEIKADGKVVYSSNFETANDPQLYNGGCRETLATAQRCTDGWRYVAADEDNPAEHAYLLEMRDRSGFDAFGFGESDRGNLSFQPGVLLAYTNEDHGYGNVGTSNPPAQTPLDSRPQAGSDTPNLDDAAYKAGDSFTDSGAGHTDNYSDENGDTWVLKYGCLSFAVSRLAGTGVGPEIAKAFDMDGDVAFTTTASCGQFDYGTGAKSPGQPVQPPATPPTQQTRPATSSTPPVTKGSTTTTTKPCKARAARARGFLRSLRTPCPTFSTKPLKVTFRLNYAARVRVDLLSGKKVARKVMSTRSRKAKRTYTLTIRPNGLKAGNYTLRMRATRGGRTRTFTLRVTRTR